MTDIDSSNDYIDVRDIIARVEDLRDVRDNTQGEMEKCDIDELAELETLLSELRGNGGDEQWEGDWYPVTLIRDSYFEDAMDELIEDIGDMPKDIPSYLTIKVNYAALQMDYSSVEYDGVTYWYR